MALGPAEARRGLGPLGVHAVVGVLPAMNRGTVTEPLRAQWSGQEGFSGFVAMLPSLVPTAVDELGMRTDK